MSTEPRGRGRPTHGELYARLRVQVDELHKNLGGLPLPAEAVDIWRGIWYEEAHHSTAIEGNTLVFKQVEQLLAENRAVGNKDLRDYLEVKGYADAADWVYNQAIRPIGLFAARQDSDLVGDPGGTPRGVVPGVGGVASSRRR